MYDFDYSHLINHAFHGVSHNAIWRIVHGVTWNDGGLDE